MRGTTTETNRYLVRIYELLVSSTLGPIVTLLTSIVTLLTTISSLLSPVNRTVNSGTLSGIGTLTGPFECVIFHNPDTNAVSVLVNNVPLNPGFSRSYNADRPDVILSISYDTNGQTIYYETIV